MPCIKISSLEPRERHFVYGASRISLCQEPEGLQGRNYLFEKRGLDVETVADFRLGFVPFGRSHPFVGRIVFPIFDVHDELVALSVRPVREEDASVQKYWNESFPKSEHLYGLNLAKYAIIKSNFVMVVEGQMDVLKMHSHGFRNTVGIMGGSFTQFHAMLLKMWTNNFVFIMDGDVAGEKHAMRASEVMKVYKLVNKGTRSSRVKHCILKLPTGNDPDTILSKYGSRKMKKSIREKVSSSGIVMSRRCVEWFQK